jgi:hypothetical protein
MDKRTTIGTVIGLLFGLTILTIAGNTPSITGAAVGNPSAFFSKNALAVLGPVTILSIIFAAAVVCMYDVTKKQ